MNPIKRLLQTEITDNLMPGKVVLLFGARRVGKTFLLGQIKESLNGSVSVLNGEDTDVQTMLADQSARNYSNLFSDLDCLIIDEAQAVQNIGQILKLIVDTLPNLKVIASGSSSFDLLNQTGEPLVGRSITYKLFPFSQEELLHQNNVLQLMQDVETRLVYGSYPEIIALNSNKMRETYLKDMVQAYLLKDILSIDGVRNPSKMLDLLKCLAYQIGSPVSESEIGNQLSMSKNTVKKYLDLLTKVFVIFPLSGYSKNLRKEISKSSKWYFYDTGILNAIISNFKPLSLRPNEETGHLWENFIISERIKHANFHRLYKNFYFWKTYDKQEVDLIEELNGSFSAFEIKWSRESVKIPAAFGKSYNDYNFSLINKKNFTEFIK